MPCLFCAVCLPVLRLREGRVCPPVGLAWPHCAIKFTGETVQGEGGPYRQFFADVVEELKRFVGSSSSLIIPSPNRRQKIGRCQEDFLMSPSAISAGQLEELFFLGVLMGAALRTGVFLELDFAVLTVCIGPLIACKTR